MFITVKLMLKVDAIMEQELLRYERSMKHEIYRIAGVFKKKNETFEFRYKYISNEVSWNCKGIVLTQAKKLYKKELRHKGNRLDFSSIWSELSYRIYDAGFLTLELGQARSKMKLQIPFYVNAQQMDRIHTGKYKEMMIKQRNSKWVAYVLVEMPEFKQKGLLEMGIDLGIKVPAVGCVSDGSVKFFGNGREIRFYQRSYRKKIQMMQKQKQFKKLRNFKHRLSRILNTFDHQISASVISFSLQHDVGVIKMEILTNIRDQFHVEITPNVYLWSYRRLQERIAYKAALVGIKIVYVNAYNTSKRCPACGHINIAKDRLYMCRQCGYTAHRDLVGARNILHAL